MYKPQLPLKNTTFSFPANPLFKNLIEGLTPPPSTQQRGQWTLYASKKHSLQTIETLKKAKQ